jgi:Zn-dependent protease/predicted transcriptional regulator
MRWSLRVGSVAGIGIYIHATFLLIIGWVVWQNRGAPPGEIAAAVGLVLSVFACVLLHELGHALTAKRFGVRTRDITLLPIGGVARLERMPTDPKQELLIAIAGPAVNVVIAAVLFGVILAVGARVGDGAAADSPELLTGALRTLGFLGTLAWINVVLVGFNLLPAFPMDGGRVLRAALAYKMDYARATRVAAGVGQVMAALFFVWGLMGNPMLLLIAVFVYMGAQAEAQMAEIRFSIGDIRVRDAMITDFTVLPADATLKQAADLLLAGSQQDFPVVDGERIVGVLSRGDLMKALASKGLSAPVAEVMRRECGPVDEGAAVERVFDRMQQSQCPLVPVTRRGKLVGMLTMENIGEWIMIRSALRGLPPGVREEHAGEEVRQAG